MTLLPSPWTPDADEWRQLLDGEPAYRARQVWQGLYDQGLAPSELSTLPAALRRRLDEVVRPSLRLEREQRDPGDGTVKWLWGTEDGVALETVLMPYRDRVTVCVSSQAGCALGCRFCATGLLGAGRDLTTAEIVDQAVLASREAASRRSRLANVVFMGMGEPLQNLGAVLPAIREINDPRVLGLSARRIAVSTVGWVPGIADITAFDLPVRLAVSLHAADDETRSRLMPINQRYPIANLLAACRRYSDTTGRRVFIEYLLLDGVNDSISDAKRLAKLLRDGNFHVNLIEYNATSGPYRGSPRDRREGFAKALSTAGIEPSHRRSRGGDIAAACGQLALTPA